MLQHLSSRQQCAIAEGATSCMGDSGGPLTVMEDGERKLIGNVSWGHSRCKKDGFPSGTDWHTCIIHSISFTLYHLQYIQYIIYYTGYSIPCIL